MSVESLLLFILLFQILLYAWLMITNSPIFLMTALFFALLSFLICSGVFFGMMSLESEVYKSYNAYPLRNIIIANCIHLTLLFPIVAFKFHKIAKGSLS